MNNISAVIATLFTIYILIKIFLSIKEIIYIKKNLKTEAIILSNEDYIKAGMYKISKEKLSIFSSFIEFILFILFTNILLPLMDKEIMIDNLLFKSVIFMLLFFAINSIINMPASLYEKFSLDKKYGFSNISSKLFITDLLKGVIVGAIFISLIVFFLSYLFYSVDNWWIYGFVFSFLLIIIINMVYPTLIAPMFNKLEILKNDELKNDIEDLLNRVDFKSSGVYSMDSSKRDSRLNAYFGGFGSTKRVVLFDTLLKKLSNSEILAVLGHELGHFKHGDVYKNIAIVGSVLFIMFAIFGNLNRDFFSSYNLNYSPYMLLSFFMLLSAPISFFAVPIVGAVSRHNEFKADEFGSDLVSKSDLIKALLVLVRENKSFPKSDPLYVKFYHTHPPIIERLEVLGHKFS